MILYTLIEGGAKELERLVEESELRPRRRRSHRKSSKERYETRRRMKAIALWLLIGAIGIVFVALIAVYAGSAGE